MQRVAFSPIDIVGSRLFVCAYHVGGPVENDLR